jgi:hypothetical protein
MKTREHNINSGNQVPKLEVKNIKSLWFIEGPIFSDVVYIASNGRMIVNDGFGCIWKEAFVPYVKILYPECLERQRKTTKNLGQDEPSPERDSNPGRPQYKAGVVTTRQWLSVVSGN